MGDREANWAASGGGSSVSTSGSGIGSGSGATAGIGFDPAAIVPGSVAAASKAKAAPSPAAPARLAARPAPARAIAPPVIRSARIPTISLTEVRTLLTRANSLLEQGDVAGARLLLDYAAQHGSKRAMLKLGETYDPDHLSKLGVRGVLPDQDQAALWYDRAAKALAAQ